jgi:NADH-quinone oxidoreductase subunit G
MQAARFVVSLEIRASAVSELADVVLPVAPVAEKAGMFVDWEGRVRMFDKVLADSNALPDLRVLSGIADEMGVDLGFKTVGQARTEMSELGAWDGDRAPMPAFAPHLSGAHAVRADSPPDDAVRVATWKMLIDHGRMLDGEDALKATGRTPVALVSPATMGTLGLTPGQHVTITGTTGTTSPTGTGSTGLPVALADLPDGVVWVPTTSEPSQWSPAAGSVVTLTPTQGAGA